METISATVASEDNRYFIEIPHGSGDIRIPISEDKSNEVKGAFNQLILRIKEGPFQVELETVGEDLFSQVASEYIGQLNREIREIYGEMKQHGLV